MIKFLTQERQENFFFGLSKYKFLEIEFGKFEDWSWFNAMFKWTRKQDHAGLDLFIEILGFWFDFHIYDSRHWNYDKDRFFNPGEELNELSSNILEDYKKVKEGSFSLGRVKEYEKNETLSWEKRYTLLEEHHLQESKAYLSKIEEMYHEFKEYINLENGREK